MTLTPAEVALIRHLVSENPQDYTCQLDRGDLTQIAEAHKLPYPATFAAKCLLLGIGHEDQPVLTPRG